MSPAELLLVAAVAVAAGLVNAVAGGGTLITFPTLVAMGVPPVAANVTNTVALCPGYVGGTLAQSADLRGQRGRLLWILPLVFVGGLCGGFLLLVTEAATFRALIPWLILGASVLLALQGPLRDWLLRSRAKAGKSSHDLSAAFPVFLGAVYGGYFGAGLGVIMLAVLGLFLTDSLIRLNALKQAISFSTNVAAALFFLFSGLVLWDAAAVMAVGALLGGVLGGRFARWLDPQLLRWLVVAIGVAISVYYFLR